MYGFLDMPICESETQFLVRQARARTPVSSRWTYRWQSECMAQHASQTALSLVSEPMARKRYVNQSYGGWWWW